MNPTTEARADIPRSVPILIVGAGPVGMSLAMEMGQRGVPVLVFERRKLFVPPEPKCNHVSSRTMETFRRFGLAEKVRKAGLPPDHPHDVVYATSFTGFELGRLRIPAAKYRYSDDGYGDGGWPTPEPPHRINQTFLEPIMLARTMALPSVSIFGDCNVMSIEQMQDAVRVRGKRMDTGESFDVIASYLVGCDGTRSLVRASIGASFEGDDGLMASSMATITAPGLADRATYNRAWMHWILNPAQTGNIIALDGNDRYIINLFRPVGKPESEVDFDAGLRILLGTDVKVRVENRSSYIGRRMLATSFAQGRVFIAGDAAHNWLPLAGYAMNAGIADAVNLGWKLAAVNKGWAHPAILESYEAERRPILDQVSRQIAGISRNQHLKLPANLLEHGAEGWLAREQMGRMMLETDSQQFACKGLNFGYFYDQSPIISYDEGVAPSFSLSSYKPSTVPGCRLPHLWLAPGVSLYDRLGAEMTLLRLDDNLDVSDIKRSADSAGFPLTVLDISHGVEGREIYDFPLVIARPDQHISWRGTSVPDDAKGLLTLLRGANGLPAEAGSAPASIASST